jgi:ferritin-like metal-binding protein YciE
MPTTVSNPRDLLVQILGELLYIERRLAGGVLRDLIDAVADEQLADGLRAHLEQTKAHVERCETAFRAIEVAPSANHSREFESAVAEHDELASSIISKGLADVFHAQAALRTEHLELALYTAILAFGDENGYGDALAPLRESVADEHEAREILERELRRLSSP